MKILNVKRAQYFIIETDNKPYYLYRRDVSGGYENWEILMGESWEPTYGHEELEVKFIEWLKDHKGF